MGLLGQRRAEDKRRRESRFRKFVSRDKSRSFDRLMRGIRTQHIDLFEKGVWAGIYLGWPPVTGILPPAAEQSRRRNTMMVTSHVLWWALTVLLTRSLIGSVCGGYGIVK